jgi:hypothetical protein
LEGISRYNIAKIMYLEKTKIAYNSAKSKETWCEGPLLPYGTAGLHRQAAAATRYKHNGEPNETRIMHGPAGAGRTLQQ